MPLLSIFSRVILRLAGWVCALVVRGSPATLLLPGTENAPIYLGLIDGFGSGGSRYKLRLWRSVSVRCAASGAITRARSLPQITSSHAHSAERRSSPCPRAATASSFCRRRSTKSHANRRWLSRRSPPRFRRGTRTDPQVATSSRCTSWLSTHTADTRRA